MVTSRTRTLGKHAWLGLALSSMFFYPLIASLTDGPYFMHWRWAHTAEFLTAWLGIAAVLGFLVWISIERLSSRLGLLGLMMVGLLPFSSMGIHLARQLDLRDALVESSRRGLVVGLALPLTLGALALVLHPRLGQWRGRVRSLVVVVVIIVSPVSVLSLIAVVKAGFQSAHSAVQPRPLSEVSSLPENPPLGSIHLLVFDEMDYGYLYKEGKVRESYSNFREFSSVADNFHQARAPAGTTLASIPGLLLGRAEMEIEVQGNDIYVMSDEGATRIESDSPENLFSMARQRGLHTRVYGWYHPYCRTFRSVLDDCDVASIYNQSSIGTDFSFLSPIFTTLVLWPNNKPFGFLKSPVYAPFHHAHVERVLRLAVAALDQEGRSFEFLHFGVPHLPFIYDSSGYNPAASQYLENDENYENQLSYVDRLFGEYVRALKRAGRFENATVIATSDHAYRKMREENAWPRVPLLVKRVAQTQRRDFSRPIASEALLRCLVVGDRDCPASAPVDP